MVWLENAGKIIRRQMSENVFWWEVPNYFAYDPDETDQVQPYVISSPTFSSFDNKCRLALIQNRKKHQVKSLGLFLWKTSTFKLSACLVRLSLTDSCGTLYHTIAGETDMTGCFGSWNFLTVSNFLRLKKTFPAGILRFACEISKKHAIIDVIPKMRVKSLVDNRKSALLDGQMSDSILKVGSREFKVHKVILVARSPVFESIFEHDMVPKKDNVVDIPDCTPESFEIFLHYLYSGSVETLSASNVYGVYYAAEKYGVDDLKEKCLKFMIDNVSVETFCDAITLALRHGNSKLKTTAVHFFCQNMKKIIKTVQWQKFMDQNSCQANELLIKALDA